jgi:hypothetical protein
MTTDIVEALYLPFRYTGCLTECGICYLNQERVHKIWAKVECGEYHVTAVSLRHYERNRVTVNIVNSHLIVIYLTTCLNEEQEIKNAM